MFTLPCGACGEFVLTPRPRLLGLNCQKQTVHGRRYRMHAPVFFMYEQVFNGKVFQAGVSYMKVSHAWRGVFFMHERYSMHGQMFNT
jgi:hypothetical protein